MEGYRGEDFGDIKGIDGRNKGESPELFCLECDKQHTMQDCGCGIGIESVEGVGGVILRRLTCESASLEEREVQGEAVFMLCVSWPWALQEELFDDEELRREGAGC